MLFLNRTLVHSIQKQRWMVQRLIYWSDGNQSMLSTNNWFFSMNCFFIYLISFLLEYRRNSSVNLGVCFLFLFFMRMIWTISSRVMLSSPRYFLSWSISTTKSLRHYKNFSFLACSSTICRSRICLVTQGWVLNMVSSSLFAVLLVKKRS